MSPEEELVFDPLAHAQLSGELFEAVQLGGLFPDSKTFVDCRPLGDAETIRSAFRRRRDEPGFRLDDFVVEHFHPPPPSTVAKLPRQPTLEAHLVALWEHLVRGPDGDEPPGSTLLPLPCRYVVPGGRFREVYYWDSYFTAAGLAASGRLDLVEDMARNFAHLVRVLGHVPNGNRVYYASRSQPPFFCSLVELLAGRRGGAAAALPFVDALLQEHRFWMAGGEGLSATEPAARRVVRLDGGAVLNRYWDDRAAPREESYREDVALGARVSPAARERLWRDLRAACESGWDFSSRWLALGGGLESARTTALVPVDLNSILYHLERRLAEWLAARGDDRAAAYAAAAAARREAVLRCCWCSERRFFFDYDWAGRRRTDVWSLAAVYPLFFELATPEMADAVAAALAAKLLRGGGLVCTPERTGQQWDAPNGWAPLQWLAVVGLQRYGHERLARELAGRFVDLARRVFERTGRMMEKYDVCDLSLVAGGGEYPVQDGFGWTNGVVLALLDDVLSR